MRINRKRIKKIINSRYMIWTLAILLSFLLFQINNFVHRDKNKEIIYISAPETMKFAFEKTLDQLKLNKKYKIEMAKDKNEANFIVTEGSEAEGELFVYSPIIAVFNSDEKLYKDFIQKEIFVKSPIEASTADLYDFDFEKIIDEIIKNEKSDIKIYYPSKESNMWEEFYNFLLFTVNGGNYPKDDKSMEMAKQKIEVFLDDSRTEGIIDSNLNRIKGFPSNSIYFMTYAKLGELYEVNKLNVSCRIMYPKSVVWHNYYVKYDDKGKIIYEALESDLKGIISHETKIGYRMLRDNYYHSKHYNTVSFISRAYIGQRNEFNVVEVPKDSK